MGVRVSVESAVWQLERSDPQRLSAMLRSVGYTITIHPDGRLVASESDTVYRYAGVDRKEDQYKLMQDGKLSLVMKGSDDDGLYYEPFQEVVGEVMWNEADYENLRLQYE